MKIILIFLVILSISGCAKYVKYVPVKRVVKNGNHLLIDASSIATEKHKKSLVLILDKYEEKYKIIDGEIYIPHRLAQDKDLLSNYTQKAEALK
jgi:hypothetical protein